MTRRKLNFDSLDEVIQEAQRLLASGYTRNGNWSLGQACRHMRLTIEANMDGYPWWMSITAPVRPLLRWLVLPKLLRGDSPAGLMTAGMFVPPDDMNDAEEIALLAEAVARFKGYQGRLYPHPGFGRLSHSEFERFHAMHAAHHLGFLA
ncbi:DUF1569 domain-containing protein [Neorhodopirellula lusitana]|uniref:DUF1569 domain-containing protein n=1 Tax=Neorhodopirellula lusitana TaxID=445327 RepID=UPI003850526B